MDENERIIPVYLEPQTFVQRKDAMFADAELPRKLGILKSLSLPRGFELTAVCSSRACSPSIRGNSFRLMQPVAKVPSTIPQEKKLIPHVLKHIKYPPVHPPITAHYPALS
jgi:hypothetical protein